MSLPLVTGLDGKVYPPKLTAEQREQLVGYVHHRHHEGASIRAIVADLAGMGDAVRRSVGWVSTVLRTWRCDGCSGGTDAPT